MKEDKIVQLTHLLFRFAPEFRRDYSMPVKFAAEKRMPHHMLFCLMILKRHGEESMSSLADKLGVSNQQMTRIVNAMVGDGYAVRRYDDQNRRQIFVSITQKGADTVLRYFRLGQEHIRKHLSQLSEEDVDAFIFHLEGIKKILEKIKE